MLTTLKFPILKKITAQTLDRFGVDHSIWVPDKAFEYQISRRILRDQDLIRSVDLSTRPKTFLIADSAGPYAQILHGIISWGLWLRGLPNQLVVCDGGLLVCDAKKISYPNASCKDCFGRVKSLLDAFGLPYLLLSKFVRPSRVSDAYELVCDLSWRQCEEFVYEHLPIGEFARISLTSYLLVGEPTESPENLHLYRQFLSSGIVMVDFYKRLFAEYQPEKLVLLNGLYLGWRIAWAFGERHGVPVVTWEVGYQPNTIVMAHDAVACYFDHSSEWPVYAARELSEAEREQIERYLHRRYLGDQGLIQYVKPDDHSDGGILRTLSVPVDSKVFSLFTNVEWDSALVGRHRAFSSQFEWIQATIRYFQAHPDLYLVIRIHPGEELIPMMETRAPLRRRIEAVLPELPANVRIVGPEEDVDSYQLISASCATLVYTSTIGLEAACLGKAVVVAGLVHYADKGFTVDQFTVDTYGKTLAELDRYEENGNRELALRYAHLLFIRSMIPHETLFRSDRLFCVTDFKFRSLRDLAPGNDPNLDFICQVIASGRAPLLD